MAGFGDWLVGQAQGSGWWRVLAVMAAGDPGFPVGGSPDLVRSHLSDAGADPDMHEMLDDAERAWRRCADAR